MDIKCIVLGEGAVGKTTLVQAFFPEGHQVELQDGDGCNLSVVDAGMDVGNKFVWVVVIVMTNVDIRVR